MAKNADAKREKILEAAKRRFAHYGLAKTTMAEIAQDLSFSKALLYYYFPDNNRLYAAVFESVIEDLRNESLKLITKSKTVQQAMENFLQARIKIIKENYSLFEFTYSLNNELPGELECVFSHFFNKEITLIIEILKKGIENKEIKVDDIELTARILLISILGMRIGVLQEIKSLFLPPSKIEFENILDLQRKLSLIFINGLRT